MPERLIAFLAEAPVAYLRGHGGLPDAVDESALASPDGVPVRAQRALLEAVAERGGDAALLGLSNHLTQGASAQPLLFVMLNARSVGDFLDKEQRYNRFFHSDHRVRVLELASGHVELEHSGLREAPARVESLYVLGIHLHMLEQIGCSGLSVKLLRSADPAVVLRGPSFAEPPAGDACCWRIAWEAFRPRREPMPGLDELLLGQSQPADLSLDESMTARLRRMVETDLAHRWTLSEAASGLHTSTRTLQRELSSQGTSFSRELERVRVETAMGLLRQSERSVTEIGYVCGFADSAHFSRRFKALVGLPPQNWRSQRR